MNGYLDFTYGTFSDTETLLRLYYCSTDEELWKMIAEGIGDAESLYKWYKGIDISFPSEQRRGEPPVYGEKDEKKAADFLDFLLDETTGATDKVKAQAKELKKIQKAMELFEYHVKETKR